jgi:hypothetical protein
MKAFAAIAVTFATLTAAHADARLDGRVELMKLTYACGSAAEYKTIRDAALRAEQMATVGTPDNIVVTLDRSLRSGAVVVNVDKARCVDKLDQLKFELKADGDY